MLVISVVVATPYPTFSYDKKVQVPRVSSYFLLLFVLDVLLVSAPSASAVSSDGALPASSVEFQQGDKMVKVLSLDAIRAITPAVSLKIFEPHENRERVYQALPVRPVLDHVFGKEWEKAREIVFTSIDGFQPSIPVEKFLAHPAYFAFGSPDNAPFTTTNPVQNNEIVQLGPLYLVWDNLNSKELLASGDSDFPYQVMRVTVRQDAPFPEYSASAKRFEGGETRVHALSAILHRLPHYQW